MRDRESFELQNGRLNVNVTLDVLELKPEKLNWDCLETLRIETVKETQEEICGCIEEGHDSLSKTRRLQRT